MRLGFFLDDRFHLLTLEGQPSMASRFDLYVFANGDPADMQRWKETGPYPWFTLPDVKLAFWRPLSSALGAADHALFGRWAAGYHLHSLAWYAAWIAACGFLFRRTLGAAAGPALVLFALFDGHFLSVGWTANRNALVAAALATWGLYGHVRWREDGWRPGLALSVGGLGAGLLGGETALGAFAYLAAYEALAGPGRPIDRLRSLAPAGLLAIAYVVAYRALGYGAYGSGPYIDPAGEPAAFLAAAAQRVPALICGLVAGPPSDTWWVFPGLRPVLVVVGILSAGGMFLLLRDARGDLPQGERRHVAWLAAGALLSLVPVAATFPSDRLLNLPSIGAAAAVAAVLRRWWSVRRTTRGAGARLRSGAAVLLAACHLPIAVLSWAATWWFVDRGMRWEDEVGRTAEIDDRLVAGQRVVLLVGPDPLSALYPAATRYFEGRPLPLAWWALSLAPEDHRLERTGTDRFDLEIPGGRFLASEFEQLFRGPDHRFRRGDRVVLRGFTASIRETDGGFPTRIEFAFDRPLEDPSLLFLAWRDGAFRRVTFPPVGQTLDLLWTPGAIAL